MDENNTISVQMMGSETVPKKPRRADAIANRQLILATAQRLFAEQGVQAVCMALIAERAKIGKGTLYRAFAHKGELCLALMDEDMRQFQNQTIQQMRETADQPALTRLDAFLDRFAHFMEFHAPLMLEVQQHNYDAQANQMSPHMWLPWLRDTIGILLQQAEQAKEAKGLDIPYLVDAILAPLNANLFLYQRQVLGFSTERISQGLRQLVINGCRSSS